VDNRRTSTAINLCNKDMDRRLMLWSQDKQGHHDKLLPVLTKRADALKIMAFVCLSAVVVWNVYDLIHPARDSKISFPKAAYRSGYSKHTQNTEPNLHDFFVYEAIRKYFPNARLIGFDAQALAFGIRSFGGLSSQSIESYDPRLNKQETLSLIRRAVVSRPASGNIAPIVIVAASPIKDRQTVLVLRGNDGERLFVSGALVPSRYSGIVDGR